MDMPDAVPGTRPSMDRPRRGRPRGPTRGEPITCSATCKLWPWPHRRLSRRASGKAVTRASVGVASGSKGAERLRPGMSGRTRCNAAAMRHRRTRRKASGTALDARRPTARPTAVGPMRQVAYAGLSPCARRIAPGRRGAGCGTATSFSATPAANRRATWIAMGPASGLAQRRSQAQGAVAVPRGIRARRAGTCRPARSAHDPR